MTLFTVWLSGLEWPINIEQTIGRMQAVLKKKKSRRLFTYESIHESIHMCAKEFFYYVLILFLLP